MGKNVDSDVWERLWTGIRELSEHYDNQLVFIGGVAVYLHVKAHELTKGFVERSHDGDFYISIQDYSALRDAEELTINRRLDKHQVSKYGVEFDVYVENQNSLLVKYVDMAAESVVIDEVRVACLEHLLLLKLDAYNNRRGSAKGRKDERDLIRIVYLLHREGVKQKRLLPYLTEKRVELLTLVQRSSAFNDITEDNFHESRKLRDVFEKTAKSVAKTLDRRR